MQITNPSAPSNNNHFSPLPPTSSLPLVYPSNVQPLSLYNMQRLLNNNNCREGYHFTILSNFHGKFIFYAHNIPLTADAVFYTFPLISMSLGLCHHPLSRSMFHNEHKHESRSLWMWLRAQKNDKWHFPEGNEWRDWSCSFSVPSCDDCVPFLLHDLFASCLVSW